jgi:opacity protein-like surface antigen
MRRSTFASVGFLALVAWFAAGTHARAADLSPVFKAPPAPVIPSWTGFYFGGHLGYGWGEKRFIDNFPVFDGEVDAEPHVDGAIGGLQAGYNYQLNSLLLGVEADFTWSDVGNRNFSCFPFGDQICAAKAEWFGTVAGRLGVVRGPWLGYVKGGAAWTNDHFFDYATCAGSQPRFRDGVTAECNDPFFANQTRVGWLVGGGLEYLIDRNWSVKLEYNYMDFGGPSVPFEDGLGGFFTEEIHQKINLIKFGFNYHLDWGPRTTQPVRAMSYAGASTDRTQASGSKSGSDNKNGNESENEDKGTNRVLAFTGFDGAKYAYSALAGALIAPYRDLDTTGLRFFILSDAGVYKYPAEGELIRGTYETADLLAGYAFEGDNYSINLLAGGNASNHMLSEVDPENRVQGTAFGVKARADAWVNPTKQTLTYAEAEYSTAFQTYYAKLKLGYDITKDKEIFFGPEVAALGDERFNQWRVGAHITQVKLGKVEVDVSGGYAHDSSVGASAYGNVELSTHF